MHRLLPVLWLSLLFFSGALWADSLVLDNDTGKVSAGGYLSHLEDPEGKLDAASVEALGHWHKLPKNLNAGYSPSVHWLAVTLDVKTLSSSGWMLHLSNALLDDVEVYWLGPTGWKILGKSGENLPREHWLIDYRSAVIPFQPDRLGEHKLLFRLQSKNALVTSLTIWQRLDFDNHSRQEALFFGLHFGFYLLLIALYGIFWAQTRAPLSGLCFLYIGLSLLNEVLTLGLIQQITGISVTISDRVLGVGFACNLMVAFRVSMQLLALPGLYPKPSRVIDRLAQAVAVFCAVMAIAGYFVWCIVPVTLVASLMMVSFSGMCAYLLWRGYRYPRIFAVVFGVFYLGLLLSFARNLGILPLNLWTENASTVATMLHMLLLSLWLIGRHEQKRRIRERWQANRAAHLAEQHSQQLALEVSQRTADLSLEIERREQLEVELRNSLKLEQRLREEQKEFVAMVSHEVRTPLAIISTLSQRIEASVGPQALRNTVRCQQIRQASSRLLALVDEYLSDDRMGESITELKYSSCNLLEILVELSQDFAPRRIFFECDQPKPVLLTDVGLLRIALRNLLANADRHSPAEAVVQVQVIDADDYWQVDISNLAQGISQKEREQLFRKYYRGQSAQQSPGAGLGLYIVQRISQQLGGDVRLLETDDETKVCFRLSLPKKPINNPEI